MTEQKLFHQIFIKRKEPVKLITRTLLIAVSINCYLVKYQAKQLLPFHYTNSELRLIILY